jgi:hypothetical protein
MILVEKEERIFWMEGGMKAKFCRQRSVAFIQGTLEGMV